MKLDANGEKESQQDAALIADDGRGGGVHIVKCRNVNGEKRKCQPIVLVLM